MMKATNFKNEGNTQKGSTHHMGNDKAVGVEDRVHKVKELHSCRGKLERVTLRTATEILEESFFFGY